MARMMIHFIRPYYLFAFVPAALYVLWLIYAAQQSNPWKKICDPHLLPTLLQPGSEKSQRIFYVWLTVLLSLGIFALAGPAWHKNKLPVYKDVSSIMLVLDLSPEMQAIDLKPDRLTRAKLKIRDLIHSSHNTQMGLVVFSGEAFVAAPLSQDASTLNNLLDELYPQMMPLTGSDMSQGITQGLTLLKQTGIQHSQLLLITASTPTAESWQAVKKLQDAGHHLNILAMLDATPSNQKLLTQLTALAQAGGGALYQFSPDASDIEAILSQRKSTQTIHDENIENANVWQDAGPWFCLILLPFVLLILREKAL